MIDLKAYTRLKAQVDQAQREHDRAVGSLDQLKKQLLDEFKCKTLEEAQELLEHYEKEEKLAEKEYNREYKAFTDKWGEVLGL